MTSLPDAVVFDCDGVLVESEAVHARATAEHLASLGTPVDPAAFAEVVGMRVRDQMDRFAELTGHDADALFAGREAHFATLVDQVQPRADVAALARRLTAAGVPVGLASAGTRPYLEWVLDRLDLRGVFRVVLTGDDVTHAKPHPEVYQRAAADLGVTPARAAAVDDSPRGVASALAAGLRTVAFDSAGLGPAAFPATVRYATDAGHLAGELGLPGHDG